MGADKNILFSLIKQSLRTLLYFKIDSTGNASNHNFFHGQEK